MPKSASPKTARPAATESAAHSQTPLQTSSSVDQVKHPPAQTAAFSWRRALFTVWLRLLLLGIGGTITAAGGVAVAQLYPAQTQKLPLVTDLSQRAELAAANALTQVPLPEPLVELLPEALAQKFKAQPDAQIGLPPESSLEQRPGQPPEHPTGQPAASASPTASPLTEAERQQMQTELTELQAELQTLTSNSSEPLASRVEELQKRIQSIQAKLNAFTAADPQPFVAPNAAPKSPDPSSDQQTASRQPLLVTLPSDALFEPGQVTLRPDTAAILSSILVDLQRYAGASIQVAAYTDQQQTAELDRQKSLQQARAVQTYLAGQMDSATHWVIVGQGHNRPLAPDDSPENRQRNRRVEISIAP